MSYRRRLILLAAMAVALAVALASIVTYVSVRAQLRDSVDDGLRSLAARVATAPLPATGDQPRRLNLDEQQRRRSFLLLLPSSPLGEQAGYAQVVSSAGRIQPPEGQRALLAAGPRVVAVAQGRADPFFYDSELSGTQVRVYVARFAEGQALQAARSLEETNATMRRLPPVPAGARPARTAPAASPAAASPPCSAASSAAARCARSAGSCAAPAMSRSRRTSRAASRRSATT